jgi:hypothetical protein
VSKEVRNRNNTISETFEDGKERSVLWIEEEIGKSILRVRRIQEIWNLYSFFGGHWVTLKGEMEESNSLRFQVFVYYSAVKRSGDLSGQNLGM